MRSGQVPTGAVWTALAACANGMHGFSAASRSGTGVVRTDLMTSATQTRTTVRALAQRTCGAPDVLRIATVLGSKQRFDGPSHLGELRAPDR